MNLSFIIAFGGPLLFCVIGLLVAGHLAKQIRLDREKRGED